LCVAAHAVRVTSWKLRVAWLDELSFVDHHMGSHALAFSALAFDSYPWLAAMISPFGALR
jgi:hypothetical protein